MAGKYYVYTYDMDLDRFTPQKGVRCGPYSLFALRKHLLRLKSMGYEITKSGGVSVLVTKDSPKDRNAWFKELAEKGIGQEV